jgi:hypothetical protein
MSSWQAACWCAAWTRYANSRAARDVESPVVVDFFIFIFFYIQRKNR